MTTLVSGKLFRSPLQLLEQVLGIFAAEDLTSQDSLTPILKSYAEAILSYLGVPKREWANDPTSSLFASTNTYQQNKFIAVALLRLLGKNAAVFEITPFRHQAFQLFDRFLGNELYPRLKLEAKQQTHEKEQKLRDIGPEVDIAVGRLQNTFTTLAAIPNFRVNLAKALRGQNIRLVAIPFVPGISETGISEAILAVQTYLECDAENAQAAYKTAEALVIQLLEEGERIDTEYAKGLLTEPMRKVLNALHQHFATSPLHSPPAIEVATSPKKYPFHLLHQQVILELDIKNSGPGHAFDIHVAVTALSDDAVAVTPSLSIGHLGVSTIRVALPVRHPRPTAELCVEVRLSWSTFDQTRAEHSFTVLFFAQRSDVDWEFLSTTEPYDLEPVTEDAELVGRKDTLNELQSLISSRQVGSAAVFGQKRVGKTSIVKTLATRLGGLAESNVKVIYLEGGDYVRPDPIRTIEALTRKLCQELQRLDPAYQAFSIPAFDGSFASFADFVADVSQVAPTRKFLIILDEFDELPIALYTQNDIADAFFLSLRSSSAKSNIGFILVGSEKMKAILNFQGHELNKFRTVRVDYFDREKNWPDFVDLVRRPVVGTIEYADEAVATLFQYTAGNPYFTKLICKALFQSMVAKRDGHVTDSEIHAAARAELVSVGVNSFLHFWEDGIVERGEERRLISETRQRVLLAYSDVLRTGERVTLPRLIEAARWYKLSEGTIATEIEEFVQRQVFTKEDGAYKISVGFFALWLREYGLRDLLPRIGERIVSAERKHEEGLYIRDEEIVPLVERWQFYKGRPIGVDDVRRWLVQFGSNSAQRLMWKMLSRLRYVRESDIRGHLVTLHGVLNRELALKMAGKVPRVHDVLVSYLDGPGKSGSQYAKTYGEENKIFHERIVEPTRIEKVAYDDSTVKAVLFIDDFLGTGDSALNNLNKHALELKRLQQSRNISVVIGVIAGYRAAADRVEAGCLVSGLQTSVRIVEPLHDDDRCFSEHQSAFFDPDELAAGKELAETYGLRLEPKTPLGFGQCAANVVFERSCPNNCLPVLWKETKEWRPLFKRM